MVDKVRRAMYRALLREAGLRGRKSLDESVVLVDPISLAFGKFSTGEYTGDKPLVTDRIKAWARPEVFPSEMAAEWATSLNLCETHVPTVQRGELVDLVRSEFRSRTVDPLDILDRGAIALRTIRSFRLLSECTSFSTTRNVRVEVSTKNRPSVSGLGLDGSLKNRPSPLDSTGAFWFDYRIRLRNTSSDPDQKVRLLGRHWIFKNESGQVETQVDRWAAGVVSRSPLLGSKDSFQYISGAEISTKVGSMEGAFLFEDLATKEEFEVTVNETRLDASSFVDDDQEDGEDGENEEDDDDDGPFSFKIIGEHK